MKTVRNPIIRTLMSPRLTLLLLVMFGVSIAVATFVESRLSTASAKAYVYNALWFEILLGLFALNLLLALTRWWPFKPRLAGFALIHISVIVILVGAGITRFAGYEGSMMIREGQSTDFIYTFVDHVRVSEGSQTLHFPVRLHRSGLQDLTREGTLNNNPLTVTVEEFWPHYGERYVEGEGGQPLVVMAIKGGQTLALAPGDQSTPPAMRVRHLHQPLPDAGAPLSRGNLVVRVGTAWNRYDVTANLPQTQTLAGYTVTVTEFDADFGARDLPDGAVEMSNPMLRVALQAPDGAVQERTLYAYHPDFSSSQNEQEGSLAGVQVDYLLDRDLVFGQGNEGLMGRCSLALSRREMGEEVEEIISAGTLFTPAAGQTYTSAADDFTFTVTGVLASGLLKGVNLEDDTADAAVRVRITDVAGQSAEGVAVLSMQGGTSLLLGGRELTLGYGPIRKKLPHRVMLDDFVLITYPGSSNPVDYESHVRLFDESQGIDGEPSRVFMNHPLSHRGFKHFQSSYDKDLGGTIFTVNYDPGKNPTYVGYGLITLGFLMVFLKDRLWGRRKKSESAPISQEVQS